MSIPIIVQNSDATFTATVIGAPEITAAGATREDAIAELRQVVQRRVEQGEISSLDFDEWLDLAGKYRDDATLDEICAEAYHLRDNEVTP
jgi:hypothetical protein